MSHTFICWLRKLSIDHMRNCSNVWQHSAHWHLCCIKIPLLFVDFVELSVTIEAYCSLSSILTHTCGLRVTFLRMYVLVTPLVAATNMADVHFSFKFGFECRKRHGCLVFESAVSTQVLVRAKDSSEIRFRTLAFASNQSQLVRWSVFFGAPVDGAVHCAYGLLDSPQQY